MTNAEKYLKDNVSVEELAKEVTLYIAKEYPTSFIFPTSLENFFNEQAKPTLTEDERVILRNIDKNYDKIGRKLGGALYLRFAPQEYDDKGDIDSTFEDFFGDHLFQFIRNGEEYSIEELLKND